MRYHIIQAELYKLLTSGDHALEMNHIRMIELSHYAGLAQELPPLFLGVAYFQRFNSHGDVPLSGQLQPSAAHLSELSCDAHNHPQAES